MNYAMVFYILGCVLKFESVFLMLPAFVGLMYKEHTFLPYTGVAALCLVLGLIFTRKRPRSRTLYTREGFV
ncbi:MAG: TrkH family potassium uptake protein, partial [Roseburia sp.]|nr:TrkH family potassium uptake protein [Roseburia sp.]